MRNRLLLAAGTIIIGAIIVACGGGSSGGAATSSGTFINSPTKGIKYSASPSGLSGTTDENGSFSYKAGDTVTFSLDLGASTVTLGSTSSPSATTSILSLTVPNGGDPLAVAQILETLDKSSVGGKMDVSGISLSAGAVLTAITNAIGSASVSEANIGTIATGVQTALTAANAGTLKYGTAGVTLSGALTNLSQNSANQSLLETKIQNLTYGGGVVADAQNKTSFSNWIIKSGTNSYFYSYFGVITSSGLTYSYKSPFDNTYDANPHGTYVLASGNRVGNFTDGDDNSVGTFSVMTSDSLSHSMTYANTTTGVTGVITGTYLLPLTLGDVKSKTYVLYGGCSNGADNAVTISSSGVSTGSCSSNLDGATWVAGPYTNTLQYTEVSGARRYIGLTRLDKKGIAGNLPSSAVGTFMNISSYKSQPLAVRFKVN